MEDPLKARLIGAVILVALAVLLIPELLSGRKPAGPQAAAEGEGRGTRTYTIDLTGAVPAHAVPEAKPRDQATPAAAPTAAPPASRESVAGEGAATEPVAGPPVVPEPAQPVAAAKAVDAARAPGAEPPRAVEVKPANAGARPGWSVQVGAFGSVAAANRLVANLKSAGYRAYIAPISKGGKTLHRVRVGPEASRGDADNLAAKLKARALPATVVVND
jgi:cell division septation protein DedD